VENKVLIFGSFFANYATIKNFSKNLSVCISIILDATFVQNLTFPGLLSPEISFGEKTVTHPDTQLVSSSMNPSAER